MKRFLFIIVLLLFCGSFISLGWAAQSGSSNGHSPSWGSSPEEFSDLVKYKTAGDVTYYQNPDSGPVYDLMTGFKSSRVVYGFKNNRFFARILRIDTVDDFQRALDHLVRLFGEPKEKIDGKTHIARWQTEELKVKLKYNKETKSMKMGTYHMPTAGKNFDVEKSFETTP